MERRTLLPRLAWVMVGGLCLYQVYLQWYWDTESMYGHIADDAYISLVYAKNLAEGNGLVYNPTEVVEGYTNFLWVLVMSVPFYLGVDPLVSVKITAAISSAVLIVVAYALARHFLPLIASLLVAGAIGMSNNVAYMSTWGLETIFYVALYSSAILALLKNRELASGILFALAAMTRMEIVLVVAVFWAWLALPALSDVRSHGARLFRFSASFGFLFGAYFIWRYLYYGHLLPNTYYAKVAGSGGAVEMLSRGARYLVDSLHGLNILWITLATLGIATLVWIVLLARRRAFDVHDGLVPLLASSYTYFLYITWVGGDVFNERFVIHVLPMILVGGSVVTRRVFNRLGDRVGGLSASAAALVFFAGTAHATPTFPASTHLLGWVQLGRYLANEPGATLATDAAGALKFYSGLRTIDILGLNDVHIAHRKVPLGAGVAGHEKQDNSYVLDKRPTYVSTWIDADGGAGRGFDQWFDFRRFYDPYAQLDTSSSVMATDRIRRVDEDIGRCELAEGARRDRRPVFDWGVWKRREIGRDKVLLLSSDLAAPRQDLLGKCSDGYIAYLKDRSHTGIFLYGPYMSFPKGLFEVVFTGRVEACETGKPALTVEVYDGKAVQGSRVLTFKGNEGRFAESIRFKSSGNKEKNVEFRMSSHGVCAVRVDAIQVGVLK